MKKVHFHINTGYAGAEYDEVEEFDDNVSEEELDELRKDFQGVIDEYLEDFVSNNIESSWWFEDEE